MTRSFTTLLLALGAIGASPLAAQASASTAGSRAANPLADTLKAWVVTMGIRFHARDAEGLIGMYADSAQYTHISDGIVTPYAQLVRGLRANAGNNGGSPAAFVNEPRIVIIDGNTAIADYDYEIRPDPAVDRVTRRGIWTGILRRGPDGWHILHAHISGHAL